MDKDDKYSSSGSLQFYYLEGLETSDVETETGIRETQEATDDFINKKRAEPNRKTVTGTRNFNVWYKNEK